MLRYTILLCCLTFLLNDVASQVAPEKTNFRAPLTIPIILSGNFCELRPNHFHTGLDIKTGGTIGKTVVSIEEGYVSRLFYSHWGYGLAVYITHPNGYTSLYGHLSQFSPKILKKVRAIQEEKQSETFNYYLDSGEIVVKKGEKIGLSGTSGSSYAPHLHFEIRETATDYAMNPLLFGFKISDKTKPDVKGIKVYPLSPDATVNGEHKEVYIKTTRKKSGSYSLSKELKAHGKIGLGLHATDRLDGAGNVCGVFNVDLYNGKERIYNHNMRFMDFDKNRYINHHMDYIAYNVKKKNIHKTFLKGNNELPIYKTVNKGILTIKTDSTYRIKYDIKDAYGNTSKLNFSIEGEDKPQSLYKEDKSSCTRYLNHQQGFFFDTVNFTVLMAQGTIYDDHCFSYSSYTDSTKNLLSNVHVMNNKDIPVHHYFPIQITPKIKFDSTYWDKLIIVELTEKGYQINRKGIYVNGAVHTRIREYGEYAVNIDTIMPFIAMVTKEKSLAKLTKSSKIWFKISDNLSGIKTYKAYLDGKWVLSNYNRRNGKLFVNLAHTKVKGGKHNLKLIISDERGNRREKVIDIVVKY